MAINVGIVVGCSTYENAGISNLEFADADARSVASVLKRYCGVADNSLIVLADGSGSILLLPRRNNVIREVSAPLQPGKKLTANIDRLFFFFSGHGFHSVADDRDYLLFQDAVPSSIEDTCISLDRVVHYLKSWEAKTTVLLIDACRVAPGGGKSLTEWQPISNRSRLVTGFATFWSCRPGERSYEARAFKKGAFTSALECALGDDGKCNTVYEIDSFLQARVPEICRNNQLPEQHPNTQIEPIQIRDALLVTCLLYTSDA